MHEISVLMSVNNKVGMLWAGARLYLCLKQHFFWSKREVHYREGAGNMVFFGARF